MQRRMGRHGLRLTFVLPRHFCMTFLHNWHISGTCLMDSECGNNAHCQTVDFGKACQCNAGYVSQSGVPDGINCYSVRLLLLHLMDLAWLTFLACFPLTWQQMMCNVAGSVVTCSAGVSTLTYGLPCSIDPGTTEMCVACMSVGVWLTDCPFQTSTVARIHRL